MSLILREHLQPIIDEAGFPMLHASINPHSRDLQLVGECGQPLATVKGITFSKKSPTIKEIEYSKPLFSTFMKNHRKKLKSVMEATRVFMEKGNIDKNSTIQVGNFEVFVNGTSLTGIHVIVRDGKSTVATIYDDGRISMPAAQVSFIQKEIFENKALWEAVEFLFEQRREYVQLFNGLQTARNALQKCAI